MRRIIVISMMLILGATGAQAQRYDRGYENLNSISTVFAPKGSFMLGGSVRYSHHRMNDYSVLVINGINSTGSTISASPSFLYMVKDNMGLGARFSYNRSHFDLESANLSVSEISMNVQDYFKLSQSYSGMILFRPYIPLGPGGRFSMFAELNLGASFSQSKNTVDINSVVKGSFVENYKIFFGVNPGFTAFLTNHMAMELSLGMLGISYGWSDQIHNQVTQGSTDAASASFMVNLASISLGLCYYL